MSAASPCSILIVLMGSLGDVARGLPLVGAIKTAWPHAKISWLVEPKSYGVVALHSGIDEVIRFERGRGLDAVRELRRVLQTRQFDIVLDLQRHLKSGVFSWFTGARRRIGFHREDAKEGNWIFSTETIPAQGEELPKINHYLSFLTALDIPVPEKLDFGISERVAGIELPSDLCTLPSPAVGVVLGSSWRSKDWVAEGYDDLIRSLLARTTAAIVLLGDSATRNLAGTLIAAHRSARVVSTAGRTSVEQLAAVISRLVVVCGPDSGPGHIAAALGVPYVGLYGPTNPARTAPYLSEKLAVTSCLGCAPCYRRECPGLGQLCMRLLSPVAVFEQVRAVLARHAISRA